MPLLSGGLILHITHETVYRYSEPVLLSPHLLYLRPRETSRQRIRRYDLQISPIPNYSKTMDPLENELWHARFPTPTTELSVRSDLEVETRDTNPFDFVLEDYAVESPFTYDPVLAFALAPYLMPPFDDTQDELRAWVKRNFLERPKNTLDMLNAFCRVLHGELKYERREAPGIQTSIETLRRGQGACRDFAVLFTELCRTLGLAARYVSGYIGSAQGDEKVADNAMHAWAEVYLPGAGWKGIDPTNGIWCDDRFVAVAHGAQAESVNPIQGAFSNANPVQTELSVKVTVDAIL